MRNAVRSAFLARFIYSAQAEAGRGARDATSYSNEKAILYA